MISSDYESSGSDYEVEQFIIPDRKRKPINDDSADLLGNFDDAKRKEIFDGTYQDEEHVNPSDEEHDMNVDSGEESENNDDEDSNSDAVSEAEGKPGNTQLTSDQLGALMRGASKANRFVIYVTNLNFESSKDDLENYFSQAGEVKSVRIPKKRRGGFAFVEMRTVDGFQRAFQLHNTELQGRKIKVQLSEGGKKKSANKKNIIKQKNRKLAEMRNEPKFFTKSGKYYDKNLKKEKAKELLARKRWRKNPAPRPV